MALIRSIAVEMSRSLGRSYDRIGSERGPVALPVFKIGRCPFGGRLGSTPRRFRQSHRKIRRLEDKEVKPQEDREDQEDIQDTVSPAAEGREREPKCPKERATRPSRLSPLGYFDSRVSRVEDPRWAPLMPASICAICG
jgi:hypothetical protein